MMVLEELDEKTRALLMVAWYMGYRKLRQERGRWYGTMRSERKCRVLDVLDNYDHADTLRQFLVHKCNRVAVVTTPAGAEVTLGWAPPVSWPAGRGGAIDPGDMERRCIVRAILDHMSVAEVQQQMDAEMA
jgi:hypothetical protein